MDSDMMASEWLELFYNQTTRKTKKGILHVLQLGPGSSFHAASDVPSTSSTIANEWEPFYCNTTTGESTWSKPVTSQMEPISPEIISKNLKNCYFRWEKENEMQILQNAIGQNIGDAIAAISKQLDYHMRIVYAECNSPVELKQDICLIDYIEWEKELSKIEQNKRWKALELLKHVTWYGAPLFNGERLYIDSFSVGTTTEEIVGALRHYPVVASINIFKHYPKNGDKVYMMETRGDEKILATHTVVLIDACEIRGVIYFAYQNSTLFPEKSMCGRGISWVQGDLINGICYGEVHPLTNPPPVLLTKDQQKMINDDVDAALEAFKNAEKNYRDGLKFFEESQYEAVERTYDRLNEAIAMMQKFEDKYWKTEKTSRIYKDFCKVNGRVEQTKSYAKELAVCMKKLDEDRG